MFGIHDGNSAPSLSETAKKSNRGIWSEAGAIGLLSCSASVLCKKRQSGNTAAQTHQKSDFGDGTTSC